MAARILIIEDNEANLELMSYLLRAFGHDIVSARDGQAGLKLASTGEFDLVLCDIQLPGLGGVEIAVQLRSDPALDRMPLVAITALAMVGDRETILAACFDGYLSKPIDPESFVHQVEAFVPPALHGKLSGIAREPSRSALPAVEKAKTILVVDDKRDNLELARSLFQPLGYQVLTATSPSAALALARQDSPDLIISDICMPADSGWDFIRDVKADPKLRGIPFVFLTSTMTAEPARQRGLALGAARFIVRPIDPQRLLKEIESCLSGRGKG
ncbi:MAG TPA: response regulator [Burkholderiales bacterium]|nr:response regulator [Burkholderiales bacterium]